MSEIKVGDSVRCLTDYLVSEKRGTKEGQVYQVIYIDRSKGHIIYTLTSETLRGWGSSSSPYEEVMRLRVENCWNVPEDHIILNVSGICRNCRNGCVVDNKEECPFFDRGERR